jgi:two-component system chemotaxis sensor kinase CheA
MKKYQGDPSICALFKTSVDTQIKKVNNALVALEKEGVKPEYLKIIKSEIHTLKGDSRMIGLESISDAAHAIEDILEQLGKSNPDETKVFSVKIFRILDAISQAVEKLPNEMMDIHIKEIAEESDTEQPVTAPEVESVKHPEKKKPKDQPEEKKITMPEQEIAQGEETQIINLNVKRIEDLISRSTVFPLYFNKFNFISNQLAEIRGEIEKKLKDDGLVKRLNSLAYQFSHELSFYDLSSRQFQNEITKLKLVPLALIFDLFPRLVRDVAEDTKKQVELTIQGKEVELDKTMVEKLKTILIHILRNAVDHGCEDPITREKVGKPREGRIVLSAFNMGDNIMLEIGDDGMGLDIERIRAKAVEKGLVDREKALRLTEDEVIAFIFESGFSTKQAGKFSGRGVGMDVVTQTVKELNGEITVKTEKGRGTSFILKLPLISSFIPITVFVVNEKLFGVPSSYVKSVLRIRTSDIRSIGENSSVIAIDGTDITLVDLAEFFGLGATDEAQYKNVIIIRSQDEIAGFSVSDIVIEKKMLIRKSEWILDKCKVIIGAVLSGRERAIPIVNVLELFRLLKSGHRDITKVKSRGYVKRDFRAKNVLLVEDSIVTRKRERDMLAEHSLNVFEVSNGKEALEYLDKQQFDAIITDIEMPVMNGLELITRIRSNAGFSNIPVIVVSSYSTYKENLRGLGVRSFVDKNEFSLKLLLEALRSEKII